MIQRKQFIRIGLVLLLASVFGPLYVAAYRERELWRAMNEDGSATAVVAQQRWFGLAGIDLASRQLHPSGRVLHVAPAGHGTSWREVKEKANALHHERYGSDSPPYFDEQIRLLAAGIAKGTSLVAYEGLPHQHWEPELLHQELATGRSVELHEFPFYKTPVPITPTDADRLSALGASLETYRRKVGMKACGGFHPDWCLQWRGAEGDYWMLICFGCCEAKLYGPRNEVWSDLDDGALKAFIAILKPYRTNRPESAISRQN